MKDEEGTPTQNTPEEETREPETPTAEPSTGGVGGELTNELPPVNTEFLKSIEDDQKSVEAGKPLVSTKGEEFDPNIHKVGADGKPYENSRGKWTRYRGNRKKGGTTIVKNTPLKSTVYDPTKGQQGAGDTPGAPLVDPAFDEHKARMAGMAAAHTLIQLGVAFGGEEWRPMTDSKTGLDEKTQLEGAFGDYCVSKQFSDFPPGLALCIAVSAYALPRFAMPKTQERALSAWQKFKLWRQSRKMVKQNKAAAASHITNVAPKGKGDNTSR